MKLIHLVYWFILKLSRAGSFTRSIIDWTALFYYKIFRFGKTFRFKDKNLKYFYHPYNRTIASERIVEIAIAKDLLRQYRGKKILEIGNVTSHYFNTSHDILDKFEKGRGVANEDVVHFSWDKRYDLIFSISTMEHVGFNSYPYEEDQDFKKFLSGIENLKKHLAAGGKLFVTLPMYFNPFIDELIKSRKMPFTKEHFMKRTSYLNEWKESSYDEAIKSAKYDKGFANANALYIGEYTL